MYYPAPSNVNLRVEWNTWRKIMNHHDSHTLTQKRTKHLLQRIYGVTKKTPSQIPYEGLSGTTVLLKRNSRSLSPSKIVPGKLRKSSLRNSNENFVLQSLKPLPQMQKVGNAEVKNGERRIIDLNKLRQETQKLLEVVSEDDLFGSKKSFKVNILPVINHKPKVPDLKLVGKQQVGVYRSCEIKREIEMPRPWKGLANEFAAVHESVNIASVAVSTDNFF